MKYLAISTLLFSLVFFSCQKDGLFGKKGNGYEMKCDLTNSTVTSDGTYMNPNTNRSNTQVDILEDLETSSDCNCIVSGMVKYRENGVTAALVDYGNGECDNWVAITVCYNGDCEDSRASCYKYEQSCGSVN